MPHDLLARHALAGGVDELPPPRVRLYLQLRGDPGEHEWAVRSFTLDEALHAPYALAVIARGPVPKLGVDWLLGGRVVFELARGDDARTVHGVVLEAELLRGVEALGDEPAVALHVVPAFALLGMTPRSRVFQGQSVVEIASAVMGPVLAKHGGSACVERLRRIYPPRDYCVQYRETDLDFVLRILADEGITVMFDHDSGVETVVLVDDNEVLPNAGREPLESDDRPSPRIPFVGKWVDALPLESIAAVGQQSRLRPREWETTGLDWLSDHATATRLRACSNATSLRAGSVFELLADPDEEIGEKWVVTAVRHEGHVEGSREPEDGAVEGAEGPRPFANDAGKSRTQTLVYVNDIECQPLRSPVVPPRSPKPRAVGMQSAVVVGPPGKVIHTDRFGRVRVRMLWDEQEHEGEPSSCWLRVATPWAGEGFGAVLIPRVGTEVLVSFIDGDPDRPICSACVHDGAAVPPYGLPGHATRTVLRTRTIGGEGFNELSFEDTAGAEEVFLHAQRNLREQVLSHHCTEVGRNQTLAVDGSRIARIGKDDTTITAGEHRHIVSGKATARYRSGYALHVGEVSADDGSPSAVNDAEFDVPAGGFGLRSVEPIVLGCGESRIELHPDRLVLRSPKIEVEGPKASLVVGDDAITLRANKKVELGADVLAAVSTGITVIKGPKLELGGSRIAVEGERVSVEAASRIEIVTVGEVKIRGTEKIELN
ncbi:type VI secretion system Vgr family protein [Paraliomyxa miuraensis]|uniref:type VI secretion system Vgr family protein n=1 Tax=Paraliomyxa miuraensis TaxID=376150 RepID=UPI00224E8A8D|nr:type VI secretion system tip protein TssI/VgrG [Paraliomyxa miuraensis]MCX4240141.1 type VI secretion system tip protein VgrG [Paraliomyxa miuraensis]